MINKFFFIIFFCFYISVFAEEIVLKYGDKINGKIIAKNDKYLLLDVKGASIIYYTFEIESVDGKDVKKIPNTYFLEHILKSKSYPNFVKADEFLNRGIAYYSKSEFDYAIGSLNQAIRVKPDYFEAYLYRGLCYAGKKSFNEAISDYNKAVELNPKNEEVYFTRGLSYASLGDLNNALSNYNKAIELNPKYVQAYLNRAFVKINKGSIEEALLDIDKVIEINSNIPTAYYIRGLANFKKANITQAILNYSKAIELDPNYFEAYANRGFAYAYSILEKSKQDPYSPSIYINVGISYLDEETFKKAISDCNKAIELNPQYIDGYLIRAKVYFLANDFDKAWQDVYKIEELGGKVDLDFLKELKRLSKR